MCSVILMVIAVLSLHNRISDAFGADTPKSYLKVAAFNIKAFGLAKTADIVVLKNIVKILRRYDLVLVQEVRDLSGVALRDLQTSLSSSGLWDYVASSPVGRTNYREQYAFFYRKKSIRVVDQYLYNDSAQDSFEREPFAIEVEYFSVSKNAFRNMVFLGLHTRPDDTPNELGLLPTVMRTVLTRYGNADGIVAMGDFNADCSYLNRASRASLEIFNPYGDFKSYINDTDDTTVAPTTNCAYDRTVSLGDVDIREAKPYNFETGLKLSGPTASNISDHYPVEFRLY